VRVPRRALRLTGCVLDLPHLVEVDERVEQPLLHAGEGAAYGEALTLEPMRRGRDRDDGTLGGSGSRRRDTGQGQEVVDDYGRHVVENATRRAAIPGVRACRW